jgi:hypothetical protein
MPYSFITALRTFMSATAVIPDEAITIYPCPPGPLSPVSEYGCLPYRFTVALHSCGNYNLHETLKRALLIRLKEHWGSAQDVTLDVKEEHLVMRGYKLSGEVTSRYKKDVREYFEHKSELEYPFVLADITSGERKGNYDALAVAHSGISGDKPGVHDASEASIVYRRDLGTIDVRSDFLNRLHREYAGTVAPGGFNRKVETYFLSTITGVVNVRNVSFHASSLQKTADSERLAQATKLLQEAQTLIENNDPRQILLHRIADFFNPK